MALTNYYLSGGSAIYPSIATPTLQTSVGTAGEWGNWADLEYRASLNYRITVGSFSQSYPLTVSGLVGISQNFTAASQPAGSQLKLEVEMAYDGWKTVFNITTPVAIKAAMHTFNMYFFNGTGDEGESHETVAYWGSGPYNVANFVFDAVESSFDIDYFGNTPTTGTIPPKQTGSLFYNARYNTGNLTKTGYAFSGWNTLANGSGTTYLENARVPSAGNLTSNLNLYAKWTPLQFTARYDAQGGTPSTQDVTVTYGQNHTLPTAPTKTYNTFGGWWTGQNGTGTQITNAISFTGTSSPTYYANWTLIPYTITYESYSGAHSNQTIYTYGSSFALSAPSRVASTFNGWYDNPGFTGSPVTNITATESGNKTFYAKYTVDADASLVWETNKSDINSGKARIYIMENLTPVDISNRSTIYGQGFSMGEDQGQVQIGDMHIINNFNFATSTNSGSNIEKASIVIMENANLSVGETGRTQPCQFNNCGFYGDFAMGEWAYYNGGIGEGTVDTLYDAKFKGLEFNSCTFGAEANFVGEQLKIDGCTFTFTAGATCDFSDSTFTNNTFNSGYGRVWTRLRFYPWRRNQSVQNNLIDNNDILSTECEELISIDQKPMGFVGKVTAKTSNTITATRNMSHWWRVPSPGQTMMIITGSSSGQFNKVTAVSNTENSYIFTVDTSEFDLDGLDINDFIKVAVYFAHNQVTNNYLEPTYGYHSNNNPRTYRQGISLYGNSCGNILTGNTVSGIKASGRVDGVAFTDTSSSGVGGDAGLAIGYNSRNIWNNNTAINMLSAFKGTPWYFGMFWGTHTLDSAKTQMSHFDTELGAILDATPSLTCTNLITGGGTVLVSGVKSFLYSGDGIVDDVPVYSFYPSATNDNLFLSPVELDILEGGTDNATMYLTNYVPNQANMSWINKYFTRTFTGNATTEPDITYYFGGVIGDAVPNEYVTNRVSVFYNTNNGQGTAPTAQTFKTTYTIKDGSYLTKNGGEFLGWSNAPSGPVLYEPLAVIIPETDLTLYAIYENTSTLNIISWFDL